MLVPVLPAFENTVGGDRRCGVGRGAPVLRRATLHIGRSNPAGGRKCVTAAAGSGINQLRSQSQPFTELDLLGPSWALWSWIPPDGSKPEPSLPGLTLCLTISVCFKKRGILELNATLELTHPGPGRGCDQPCLSFLPSSEQPHNGYLLCCRPCAGH